MVAQRKPLRAFNGLKNLLANSATRLGYFLAPGFGMTRRVSRAGAAPAAFLCPVRFQSGSLGRCGVALRLLG